MIEQQMDNVQQADDKQQKMLQGSLAIINLADNEVGSALKCIHQLSVIGGATAPAFLAIEERVLTDQDIEGAYHLATLAQETPDLPIDAKQLYEMVVDKGDNRKLLSLLKILPVPPVDKIKKRIIESMDKKSIEEMNNYLADNPKGKGSSLMLANGQVDQVIALD